MTIFKEYEIVHSRECEIRKEIGKLVEKWADEHIGFVEDFVTDDYTGLTRPSEVSWSIYKDHVTVCYSAYKDKYGDYWSNDNYIEVSFNDLLKYAE